MSSTIGASTVIRGNVRGEGDLEILGRVEGSVDVDGHLVIADGALVKSDVRAKSVVVRGAIAGNVNADDSLVLEAGARVIGDLGAPRVGIRPGALFRGYVDTASGKAAPARSSARAEPKRAPQRAAPPPPPPAPSRKKQKEIEAEAAPPPPPPPAMPKLKRGARGSFKKR